MKKFFIIFLPLLLFGLSPFESPKPNEFELSAYETKEGSENKKASENKKIKCRLVCDKKVYNEQRISEAVEFYKNSPDYFSTSK